MVNRVMKYVFCMGLLVIFATAAEASDSSRKILALYDSTEAGSESPSLTAIHLVLEMPLNQLGLVVDYVDINDRPLPDIDGYRGILIWFSDNEMKDPQEYLKWLRAAQHDGVKLIVIDGLGAAVDKLRRVVAGIHRQKILESLGIIVSDRIPQTSNPFVMRSITVKKEMFNYEVKLPNKPEEYDYYQAADTNTDVWAYIERTDIPDSKSVAVAVTPGGGFISTPAMMIKPANREFYEYYWNLNLFAFFEKALDCEGLVRMDVTTQFGCRAAYSHVDGDGMINGAQDLGTNTIASQILLDQIFKRFPVPISMGMIAGRVNANCAGTEQAAEIAREMFALPNIEPASHGYAHMFDWKNGIPGLIWDGYHFSTLFETQGSIDYLNEHIAAKDKPARLLQWTGDCAPQEQAIADCDEAGILNINGGDSRYDRLYRSISNIRPLMRMEGTHRQVYASAQNENIYTDLWTQNFGGFKDVIDTFKNTEAPRRLLPVNIYYHVYSAERLASLNALIDVYTWAMQQPLCWIWTTEYVMSVNSFVDALTGTDEEGVQWVKNYGACRTVRLDSCPENVDIDAAEHVLGFTHVNGALYVTLDEDVGQAARIPLTRKSPSHLFLESSTSALRDVAYDRGEWRTKARLFAPGKLILQGALSDQIYEVAVGSDEWDSIGSTAEGRIVCPLPQGLDDWVDVRVRLSEKGRGRREEYGSK